MERAGQTSLANGQDCLSKDSRPTQPGHPDRVQDQLELRTVTALPGGDQQRQRLLSLLTRQMNLRGEPASRPAQSMVFRFGAHLAWRFLLHSTAPAGTGSMLVCPADGGVDIGLPEDQPGRISPRLQQRQQPGPHTPTLPSPEQSVHRLPRSRTRTAGPATELRSEPATAHRLPAADSQATCDVCPPRAATTPAPTTAHQKDPLAPHLDHHRAGRTQESDPKTRPSRDTRAERRRSTSRRQPAAGSSDPSAICRAPPAITHFVAWYQRVWAGR
ncbi:hypothetical protein Spla01_06919 [Streptomyces platensis]|uniref:Uncharacterized protein n=1 Tax=Streptomyces platensis TaxID=58346 RepID=A0ABX3Y2Y5_STRPT|nr:hypothetical protein BG653_01219 [Streptomyces platensis]